MHRLKKPIAFALVSLLLVSCAPSLPITKNDSLALPQSFPIEDETASELSVVDEDWQKFFGDPQLISLIDTACKNNQDLSILEQEINVSNNEIMSRQGEYIPKLGLQANGGSEQVERFSTPDANGPTQFGRGGLIASWEIDIWKKLRNAAKSAYYRYLSSIEGRRYVITNLVAEVASSYFELMALDNQLKIVEDYIEILSKIKKIAELQQKAGRVTSLPAKRFEAEVLKNQSRRYQLLQQIVFSQNKLNLLLGRFPQSIDRDPLRFSNFTLAHVYTSVPTKLLDNRPDIRKAQLELQAAKLNVDVARARFYPALSIEGGIGYEHFSSAHFATPSTSLFYGIAAGLTAPLLNRMAIKADYYSANNKQIAAIYSYELSMLRGFTEVVNQLNNLKNLASTYSLKDKQVKALNEAVEISYILFKAARVDYIETLFTQRDALESQIELIEIKKQQLGATVALYKALGGGWKGKDKYQDQEEY